MTRPVRTELSRKSLKLMGIPTNFLDSTLNDFDTFNDSTLDAIKTFVANYMVHIHNNFENNCGIFFSGSNGQGKTMLSSIVMKEAYRNRYTCRRVTLSDYISRYTKLWNNPTPIEVYDFEARYKEVEFLVLEEVGKEIDNKISSPILEELLRYREDNCLPVIICTNLSTTSFADRYGESIASLIKGNTTVVTINGKDNRAKYYRERLEDAEQ